MKDLANYKIKDITGNKYGMLTVISFYDFIKRYPTSNKLTSRWLCLCDCGKEKIVRRSYLKTGQVKSCGCLKVNRLPYGKASERSVYNGYKRDAIKRNYEFNITEEQAGKLFRMKCYYCGCEPKLTTKAGKNKRLNGEFTYNGIDRFDNSVGYIIENCVPCCNRCNISKNSHSAQSHYDWIKQSYEHLKSQGKIE